MPSEACIRLGKWRIDRSTSNWSNWKVERAAITASFLDRQALAIVHCCMSCLPVKCSKSKQIGPSKGLQRSAIMRSTLGSEAVDWSRSTAAGSVSSWYSTSLRCMNLAACDMHTRVDETGHARLNVLKQRPRKRGFFFHGEALTFFFHCWHLFDRQSQLYATKMTPSSKLLLSSPDPWQVHAEHFSLLCLH